MQQFSLVGECKCFHTQNPDLHLTVTIPHLAPFLNILTAIIVNSYRRIRYLGSSAVEYSVKRVGIGRRNDRVESMRFSSPPHWRGRHESGMHPIRLRRIAGEIPNT